VTFDESFSNHQSKIVDEIDIPIIGLNDLIINKKASGRPKDIADVDELKELL